MPDLFPDAPQQVSLRRQLECVLREIGMRERVYSRRVASGDMLQSKADDEIAAMRAVADTLRNLQPVRDDAERYRWLRTRDLDTIDAGGVFAGITPQNRVINGKDLDRAVDQARALEGKRR